MRIPAKKLLPALLVVAVAGAGYLGWRLLGDHGPGAGFVSGNGRIEATEIDVAAKLPGRVQDVLVRKATLSPPASRWRACRSIPCWPSAPRPWPSSSARSTAWPAPPPRPRSVKATNWRPRPWWRSASELDAARRRLARSETLSREGASSIQELDDDRAACAASRPPCMPRAPR